MKPFDCELYLKNIKDECSYKIKKLGFNPDIILFKPKTGDKSQDDANDIYVRNKSRHLEEVGFTVIIIEDRPTLELKLDKLTPCMVQKTETFKEDLEIINKHPFLVDIEYINDPNNYDKVPTPNGVVNMMKRQYNMDFTGKRCVIINRSEIIGIPLMRRLLDENANIIVHHSKTNPNDLFGDCMFSNFVFTGVGIPSFIYPYGTYIERWLDVREDDDFDDDEDIDDVYECLKGIEFPHFIDFGISRDENGNLCGDLDIDDINSASYDPIPSDYRPTIYYTPTPKGTGLTTIAQLIENATEFAERSVL